MDDFGVQCAECSRVVNPYEEVVYVWNIPESDCPSHGCTCPEQVFMCEQCDSEAREIYSTEEQLKLEWP